MITHSFSGVTGGSYLKWLDEQTRISKSLRGGVMWPSGDTYATY